MPPKRKVPYLDTFEVRHTSSPPRRITGIPAEPQVPLTRWQHIKLWVLSRWWDLQSLRVRRGCCR